MLAICLLFGTALAEQTGRVHGGWLLLRDAPSYSGAVRSSYPSGTVVTITGQAGSWYAVTAPDGLKGYMLGRYLTVSATAATETSDSSANMQAWVTSSNGNNVRLRTGPGKSYGVLASYAPGTECLILERGSTWSKIRIGSYTGYMMTRYLTTNGYSKPDKTESRTTPAPGESESVWVISSNGLGVHLRAGAGKSYASIGFYPIGTYATMITPGDLWSYIRIGSSYGYMMTRYLSNVAPEHSADSAAAGSFVTSPDGRNVNLRIGPGMQFEVIGTYPAGTQVVILSQGNAWDYIRIGSIYGYMMRRFIHEGVQKGTQTSP